MDPAIKTGFAIGLVIAAGAGYFGWREGWWPSKGVATLTEPSKPEPKRAEAPPAASAAPASPAPAESPKPEQDAGAKKPSSDVAALTSPVDKPAPPAPGSEAEKGAFDIVRVEPTGETVVAGRCAADCEIELKANGKTIDTAKADGAGNWAMTPPQLPPGDHELGLAVKEPDGGTAKSEQSVTVSVPETPKGEVVVVLNEPNAPSKILQKPGQPPAAAEPADQTAARDPAAPAAPEPKTPAQRLAAVSIGAVDAEKGRLFVQGTAPEGASLRVYLNNALIAQPIAGGDERWSVRVEKGLTPGDYAARVDHVETPSGKVIARAEARFTYEGEVAEATPKAAEPKPEPSASATKNDPPALETPKRPTAEAPPSPSSAAGDPTTPPADSPPAASADRQASSGEPAPAKPETSGADAGRSSDIAAAPPSEPKSEAPAPAPSPPGETSAKPDAAPPGAAAAGSDPANPVVASIETASVARGDSLWRISRKTYGAGMRYTVIFTANDKQIRDPDLIYPGQVLVLPADPAKGNASAR